MSGIRRRLVVGLAFVVAGALTRIGIFPAEPAEASPRKGTRSGNATRALTQPTSGLQNVLTWNMCGWFGPLRHKHGGAVADSVCLYLFLVGASKSRHAPRGLPTTNV